MYVTLPRRCSGQEVIAAFSSRTFHANWDMRLVPMRRLLQTTTAYNPATGRASTEGVIEEVLVFRETYRRAFWVFGEERWRQRLTGIHLVIGPIQADKSYQRVEVTFCEVSRFDIVHHEEFPDGTWDFRSFLDTVYTELKTPAK